MSHFVVYVFTEDKDVDTLLAPYNEDMVVAPYIEYTKEQAIAKKRKEIEDFKNDLYTKFLEDPEEYKKNCTNEAHIKYLEEEFPKKLNWTDEECYEEIKQYYNENEIDEQGNLWSKYPPNAKWDWYTEGGRWNDCLITKEGTRTNEDYASEIDWNRTSAPFAFVDSYGRWYERGEMGWWGIVTNEKDKDEYDEMFNKFVKKLDEDTKVTVVDCHI